MQLRWYYHIRLRLSFQSSSEYFNKLNHDKCHPMTSSGKNNDPSNKTQCNRHGEHTGKINTHNFNNELSVKTHTIACRKASQRFHALSRSSNSFTTEKLKHIIRGLYLIPIEWLAVSVDVLWQASWKRLQALVERLKKVKEVEADEKINGWNK